MTSGRRWHARLAGAMAFALGVSLLLATAPASPEAAVADGSQDLFPGSQTACNMTPATMTGDHTASGNTTSPTNPCRYLIEWRTETYGPVGGQVPRRSLFWVYANAGEYILTGSSEFATNMTGGTGANVVIWKPDGTVEGTNVIAPNDTPRGNLDTLTNAQLAAREDWRCTTGPVANGAFTTAGGAPSNMSTAGSRSAAGQSNNNSQVGRISTRAQELAGARAVNATNGAGYVPCAFQAPETGFYAVAFYGYGGSGATGDSGGGTNPYLINHDFTPLTSGGATQAWDISVRANANATAAQEEAGRVFTYALVGFTGAAQSPIDLEYWLTTLDGFRYRVRTNGIDPVGFALFGNDEGILNDDGTPLHHNMYNVDGAANGNLVSTPQGGTILDQPLYPMTFDGGLSDPTRTALGIPSPQAPLLTGLSYDGALGGNESYGGVGGTFYIDTAGRGTAMIVISSETNGANCATAIPESDPDYWDPTNPCNSTLYVDIDAPVTDQPAPWYGKRNNGEKFPIGDDFPVKATLRGGEYHMPMIDLEAAVWGSPTITLENPPGGTCPVFTGVDGTTTTQSCNQAFFDDRGYTTAWGGVQVGQQNTLACTSYTGLISNSGLSTTPYAESPYASDPLLGFNTLTEPLVRAFGSADTAHGQTNANNPCTDVQTGLGDAAALELWTFFPSVTYQTGDPGIEMPDVKIVPEPLNAVDDGPYNVAADNTWYTSTAGGNHPAAQQYLSWNDSYDAGATLTCQVATNAAGTAWSSTTGGNIYNSSGTDVGDIELIAGGNPCDYRYRFATGTPNGAYTAKYRLSDGTNSDIAIVTLYQGVVTVNDLGTTRTGGPAITGNVRLNDVCSTGGTPTVNWQGDWVASPAQPYGTIDPADGALANQSGTWMYLPNGTFSGAITRVYETNRTDGPDGTTDCVAPKTATVTLTVVPVAVPDSSQNAIGVVQGWNVGDGENLLANDMGRNAAGGQIDTVVGVSTANVPIGGAFNWNANGTWSFTPPAGWSGVFDVPYQASGAGGVSQASKLTVRVVPDAADDVSTYQMYQANTGAVPVLANDHGTALTVVAGAPVYETPCPSCTFSLDPNGVWHFTPAPGYDGSVTVPYTATDASGQTVQATLTLTELTLLSAIDDGPYEIPADNVWRDSTNPFDHPLTEQRLTWNDIVANTAAPLSCVFQGAADATPANWNGTGDIFDAEGDDVGDIELLTGTPEPCDYRYRLAPGTPAGSYFATYRLSDGVNTDTATVTFFQGAGAIDDVATAYTTGTQISGNVMPNDACQVGGAATVNWLGNWVATPNYAPNGTLTPGNGAVTNDGSWTYTPNADFSGTITRQYQTNRAPCDNNVATLTITVVPAAADDVATPQLTNVTQTGNALNGTNGTADHGRNAAGGLISLIGTHECLEDDPAVCAGFSITSAGAWTFVPPTNWSGVAEFEYTATGAGGESLPATITITVLPHAFDDTGSFLATQTRYGNVLGNDHGTDLVVTSTGTPTFPGCTSGCSLAIGPDGTYTLVPGVTSTGAPWVGTATITYTATDEAGSTTSATLTLVGSPGLDAVNDPRMADGSPRDAYVVPNLGTWYVANGLTGTGNTQNTAGNHRNAEALLTWNDTFDGSSEACQFASNATEPATSATWANNGNIYAYNGTDIGDIQLINGGDPCDFRYQIVTTSGTALEDNGSGYARYQLCDVTGCDVAYVFFARGTTAVMDSAETTTGGAQVSGDVDANDLCTGTNNQNVDWNQGNWTASPNVAYGTVSPANGNQNAQNGAWSYTPNTTFSGTIYRDYENNRTNPNCTQRVSRLLITVRPVANNDVATPAAAWATGGTPLSLTGNVLNGTNGTADQGRNAAGNQIDRAGYVTCLDTATVCGWFQMQNGNGTYSAGFDSNTAAFTGTTATTLGNGAWRFQPPAGWSGIVQVQYTAYGAGGWSEPAFLTIRVTPSAFSNTGSGPAWDGTGTYSPVTGNVLTDGAPGSVDLGSGLHVVSHTAASHGELVIHADGSYAYVPDAGWSGVDTVTYTAYDADGQAVTAQLAITIAPQGVDEEATLEAGEAGTGNVLVNDLANDPVVTGIVEDPADLACAPDFAIDPDGTWHCTPEPGFSGDIVVHYEAEDEAGQPYTATLTIHVPRALFLLKTGENELAQVIPMDGSEWALYSDAGLTTEAAPVVSLEDPLVAPTLDPDTGLFRITGLADGTYHLVETKAMAGFAPLAEPLVFSVAPDGTIAIVSGDSDYIGVAVVDGVWRITVQDAPSLELPEAGGPGSMPFLAGGAALIALAIGLLAYSYRPRRSRGRHARPSGA